MLAGLVFAISLVAELSSSPVYAQGSAATPEEMERAKEALAESLKREQVRSQDQGSAPTAVAPSPPPLAEASPRPPAVPSEPAASPSSPPTVPIAVAPVPRPKSRVPVPLQSDVAATKLARGNAHLRAARKRHKLRKPHELLAVPAREQAPVTRTGIVGNDKRRARPPATAMSEQAVSARSSTSQRRRINYSAAEPLTTGSLPKEGRASARPQPAPPLGLALPATLAPPEDPFDRNRFSSYREGFGFVRGTLATLGALEQPLAGVGRSPIKVVEACRDAIAPLATARGATRIDAAGAGRSRRARDGVEAPIEVRVLYKGLTGYEAQQATISCALNRAGQVEALSATPVRAAGEDDPSR